jgi:hypothetical protein
MGSAVGRNDTLAGREGEDGMPSPLEALDGLNLEARQAIIQVIKLHREFPSWAVWLPSGGRSWTAVRPASGRPPGPDLPLVWVHAESAGQLASRMRGVDGQLASP